MVTRSTRPCQTPAWKRELAQAFRTVEHLIEALGMSAAQIPDIDAEAGGYPLLVPRRYAELMTPGNPMDPLLRQVLPLVAEHQTTPGFLQDPVGDGAAERGDGLLQKYAGRALWLVTEACGVHCRYCFRRHRRSAAGAMTPARIERVLGRLRADPTLHEIILSGGDPLLLDDPVLGRLIQRLGQIAHLKRLRLHTRLPIVLPSRVTEALCETLAQTPAATLIVVHANHPRELAGDVRAALGRLRQTGSTLLSQTVLLRGVNDRADTLAALAEGLFDCGVLPYYLHQLDRVSGAAHFEVSDREALTLIETLRARLPGYLVPRLVREIQGADAKQPLYPC